MTERTERVGESIKEEISMMLEKEEVKDPRIGFVTITGVSVSPDLRHANVYFSTLGSDKKREAAEAGLTSAKGFIRAELGKRLHLKIIPELVFQLDKSVEYSDRIARLLQKLKKTDGE